MADRHQHDKRFRVAILGASGYTGADLVRLLAAHPRVDMVLLTAERKAGQPLAVVEAMKMENILRAERDAVVATIKATPGDSLAVDDVILEFEGAAS